MSAPIKCIITEHSPTMFTTSFPPPLLKLASFHKSKAEAEIYIETACPDRVVEIEHRKDE
jgi:hypothetical protein